MSALHVRINSDPAAIAGVRRRIEAIARDCGLDERQAGQVGLCVNEALANIIRHAYQDRHDQPIELHADPVPDGIKITLRDWGSGRDPCTCPPLPRDPLSPGGLGMICLRELMDEVVFTPQDVGMLLTMRKSTHAIGADTRPVT